MVKTMVTLKGLHFALPEGVKNKRLSVIEVGPYDETGIANELNEFFGTEIKQLFRIKSYGEFIVMLRGLKGIFNSIKVSRR